METGQPKSSRLIDSAPAGVEAQELEERARHHLEARLGAHYTSSEISEVSALRRRVLPPRFELQAQDTEMLRTLAKFSQIELRPAAMHSHRRLLGPIIVFVKRITWPFFAVHLKGVLASIREFNSRALLLLARQLVEIDELRREVKQLRKTD